MSESKASRRLLKSPPELWSEVSNAASLQRHMAQFGDIRITELESESAVAWEGEHARGTIRLEPSGWGTRVSLTAQPVRVGPNGPVAEGKGAEAGRVADEGGAEAGRVADEGGAEVGRVADEGGAEADSAEVQMGGEIKRERGASGQRADGADGPRLPPPRAPASLHGAQTDVHDLTALSEHGPREAEERTRRWPKRLAETVRRWLSPQPQDDRELVEAQPVPGAPAAELEPQPAAAAVEPSAAELEPQPAAPADTPPSAQANAESPEGEGAHATTVALNAALDSLGRAHHRPFSRA